MAHDDAVTDPDGEEFEGGPACHADSCLDCLGDLMEMKMAGDDLIGRVGNPDHGLFDSAGYCTNHFY